METFSALLALCAGNSPVPVNSPHKGQWRGALIFSLIFVWIDGWVNSREAGDLRRHRGHYDVSVRDSWRWNDIHHVHILGLWCQKQVSRIWISNYIPRYQWDAVTYPCHRYLLQAQSPRISWFRTVHLTLKKSTWGLILYWMAFCLQTFVASYQWNIFNRFKVLT